jgi:hypothetical protein
VLPAEGRWLLTDQIAAAALQRACAGTSPAPRIRRAAEAGARPVTFGTRVIGTALVTLVSP